ncbi:alpha/beta hydrolase [Gammaproteobacteria bacterium]|nr:alpha/beta hydrolase [Gammaproteobacteria bacterium]MDC0919119.1 alpha/beta hydrolase [Gammaproteobacteria bacterium]
MKNKFLFFLILAFSLDLFSFEDGFATNQEIKIAYRDHGPENGIPILLVTGLGAQLTLWPDFLIRDLQKNNYRPIAFDNRDVGLSTRFTSQPSQTLNYLKYFMFIPINSEYSIQDMASDGVAVLDHLNIESAHILGMSMGGMISQVLVAQHPERVKSFTMISSTASTPNPFNGPKFKVTQQLLKRSAAKDDIEGRIDQSIKLFELIGTPGKDYDTPQFRQKMRAYIKRGGDDGGFLRQMAAIIGSKNRKELLKSINTQTLIIHGDIDPLIKVKNAYSAHKLIQSSHLEVVEDMGHLLDEESYAKFQNQFIEFLGK